MDSGTFASIKDYKSLAYVMDQINKMLASDSEKHNAYKLSLFINKFNKACIQLEVMNAINHLEIILNGSFNIQLFVNLMWKDYQEKIEKELTYINDPVLISHLKNFMYTKLKVSGGLISL